MNDNDSLKIQKSRTEMATRNIIWAYGNSVITVILKFICRWAFINTIGITYLGINGLYTSILNVLSLTELGIGTAMSFSLYKPVAERNFEQIKSLMQYYKNAYRIIALIVAVVGLAIVPFLDIFIKGADGVNHLTLYYLFFLFNTVSSYFVSYKYSLNAAEQQAYIINNITTVTMVFMSILQIIVLFVFHSFIAYLIIQSICLLLSKIFASIYLDKKYPYLNDSNVKPLDEKSKKSLFINVKALIVHKLGDVAVNQTDNIIISYFINVVTTGLISNYTLVTSTVDGFLTIVFNNITGSLGNLCATADKQKQYTIYKTYDFVSYWLFGFAAIAYTSLIQPFTQLMWGKAYIVDFSVVLLMIINTYLVGQRISLNNMKIVSGIFVQDQFLPAVQAIINLGVSVVLVQQLGLIGVYIGTIISGLVPTFIRPFLVYRLMFDRSCTEYFKAFIQHSVIIVVIGAITWLITSRILLNLNWINFLIAIIITALLPNIFLFIINRKSEEFVYIISVATKVIHKIKK